MANDRSILAVFAHPDDEGVVSPILARYAREGCRVHLAIVTDGRNGVGPHAGIPAGEALSGVRAQEAECACRCLGIEPPRLLGVEDGAVAGHLDRVEGEVCRLFEELDPDLIITWGPDGLYGHPDHRLVGDIVTQVFQTVACGKQRQLYYTAIPAGRLKVVSPPLDLTLYSTQERYLTARIAYTEEDFARAREAFYCHRSQFTRQQMDVLMDFLDRLQEGICYLRPWFSTGRRTMDLFDVSV